VVKIKKYIIIVGLFLVFILGCNDNPLELSDRCFADSDCVPASCCHPDSCVVKDKSSNCEASICTMDCKPNTLDCNQGSCTCENSKCIAKINSNDNNKDNSQIANPASVFCTEQGYTLEIRTDEQGGQSGICIFPDGSECEEWEFYRGNCSLE